jgi:hypothetical protein
MILQRVGAAWELVKVGGLVLWPLRFIPADDRAPRLSQPGSRPPG